MADKLAGAGLARPMTLLYLVRGARRNATPDQVLDIMGATLRAIAQQVPDDETLDAIEALTRRFR